MKKTGKFIIILLLAVTFGLTAITGSVVATSDPVGSNDDPIAPGKWSGGEDFYLDLEQTPPPNTWMRMLGKGLKVTNPGRICHKFYGGRFGWTADIYHLVGGVWQKLPTTLGWDSNEEGNWVACATAPSAGTYAMFGYWTKPAGAKDSSPSCLYDTSEWTLDKFGMIFPEPELYLVGIVPGVPLDTPFTYTVIDGDDNLIITGSGSGVVGLSEGPNVVEFTDATISILGSGSVVIRLSGGGCSANITWNFEALPLD